MSRFGLTSSNQKAIRLMHSRSESRGGGGDFRFRRGSVGITDGTNMTTTNYYMKIDNPFWRPGLPILMWAKRKRTDRSMKSQKENHSVKKIYVALLGEGTDVWRPVDALSK